MVASAAARAFVPQVHQGRGPRGDVGNFEVVASVPCVENGGRRLPVGVHADVYSPHELADDNKRLRRPASAQRRRGFAVKHGRGDNHGRDQHHLPSLPDQGRSTGVAGPRDYHLYVLLRAWRPVPYYLLGHGVTCWCCPLAPTRTAGREAINKSSSRRVVDAAVLSAYANARRAKELLVARAAYRVVRRMSSAEELGA